jgi:phospholipid transport system substrate-binding protein
MLNFSRPVFLAGFLAIILNFSCFPAMAQGSAAAVGSQDPAVNTAQGKFVQGLGDRAISILADKNLNAVQRNVKFRQMLRDSFDLNTIGRFVIGRNWQVATPEQQKEYMRLFEELVIKTYSDRFALYTGEGFRVRAVRPEGDRDFIVNSDITHPDGSPSTLVDWRLRQKDGKLGIIDVVVEGVSMSVTQRQEYASVIERSGGNIDGLLDLMRQRIQDSAKATAANNG